MTNEISQETQKHLEYLSLALSLARKSPPKPTNFCVGALLVDASSHEILSTGYTLELEGNTHAEQCCLAKLASQGHVTEDEVGEVIPVGTVLYTTMEPCWFRLSGNLACVQRILDTKKGGHPGIQTVVCGVKEPEKFVGENEGRKKLEAAGINVIYVTGLEEEILAVATAGHDEKQSTS
jgi:pyrimidine deaminase RibD-like protein